ncbi:MAG: hypothetical protein NZ942_03405 [Candidatus Aenigmarchaeota archaeon]|nr:hypothetical protein [Candidatus Aenigmarchaeota archaeon]
MKKAIIICMILLMPVFAFAEQQTQKYSLNKLFLPNFVYAPCFSVKPDPNTLIWVLDERFFNIVGSTLAPTSCKGGKVCWSWKVLTPKESLWDMQIFSSELPLKISDTQKLSESVSQTIKKSISLRKSLSNVTKDAQDFIKNNFESSDTMTKEKSISKSKTTEKTTELNIIPQFHLFLSKALMGHRQGSYPFCISSAVDLFFKAYYSDRVNDLVEAFTIYKTVKPEDIDFSNQNDMLNRAKFLYTIAQADLGTSFLDRQQRNDAAWAQAVLFAKLLDWKEFQEVRQFVDSEIQKAHSKYDKLIKSTTVEIAKTDKNLAAAKYYTDTEILKLKEIDEKTLKEKQNEIRDNYMIDSIVTPEQKIIQNFEKALSQNDPMLNKKTVKTEILKLPKIPLVVIPIAIVLIGAVTFVLIKKKKKK